MGKGTSLACLPIKNRLVWLNGSDPGRRLIQEFREVGNSQIMEICVRPG